MPTLDIVSRRDAQLKLSLTGKRGALMRQCMGYIGQLEPGQAGKLTPDEGETTTALRRRLGAALICWARALPSTARGTSSSSGQRMMGPPLAGGGGPGGRASRPSSAASEGYRA